jgi:hypothetical protein
MYRIGVIPQGKILGADLFSFSPRFFFWKEIKPTFSYHILFTAIHADDCQEW